MAQMPWKSPFNWPTARTYWFEDCEIRVNWTLAFSTKVMEETEAYVQDKEAFIKKLEYYCVDYAIKPVNRSNPPTHSTQIGGSHYKDLPIQPWAAMKAWLTPTEYIGFLRGNIIKYQARAQYKDSFEENIAKAAHYTQELADFMKGLPKTQDDS